MLAIPEEYKGSVCEVKTLRNELLTTGCITDISQTSLKLSNPGDRIDIITYKTLVKVSIFNTSLGFKALIGSVYTSTPEFLVVEDIQSLTEFEKREYFRINVNMPGRLIEKLEGKEQSVAFEDVKIENISLGGILFSCNKQLPMGAELYVDLSLPQGRDVYECTVCRVLTDPEIPLIKYGCKLENSSRKQEDILWRYILHTQQEELRQRRLRNANNIL